MPSTTPVNDHPTLTHEAIMEAIRHRAATTLRQYAGQARDAGAYRLADELDELATELIDLDATGTRSITGPRVLDDAHAPVEPRVTVNYGDGNTAEFCMYQGELYGRYRRPWGMGAWERRDASADVLDHAQRLTIAALRMTLTQYRLSGEQECGPRPADLPMG